MVFCLLTVIHYSVLLHATVTTGINIVVLHLLTSFLFLAPIIIIISQIVVPLNEEIGLSAQCILHVDLDPQGEHISHGHSFQPSFSHPCLVNCHSPALTFNVVLRSPWTSLFSRHTRYNSPLLVLK